MPSFRPASRWQLRSQVLELSHRPLLMGIVNVTPDSFSDGGTFHQKQAAIDHARRLVDEGAELIDVGGESTRPYSDPVAVDEEMQRVLPVVERLVADVDVPISIDTSKSAVARAAADLGVEVINDVTALVGDEAMVEVARASGCGVCAMHMRGTPQDMQDDPRYEDVVEEVCDYLRQRRDALMEAGISQARIALDPGIGFGKTHGHNLELMSSCSRFHRLGCPLLVGHSRKGFLGHLLGDRQADRRQATVGAALALAAHGVQIIRVHDVQAVREALLAFIACGGGGAGRPR